MNNGFTEITLHKQLDREFCSDSCIVELSGIEPITISSFVAIQKVKGYLLREFRHLSIGSSLRIMVLTEEREVCND